MGDAGDLGLSGESGLLGEAGDLGLSGELGLLFGRLGEPPPPGEFGLFCEFGLFGELARLGDPPGELFGELFGASGEPPRFRDPPPPGEFGLLPPGEDCARVEPGLLPPFGESPMPPPRLGDVALRGDACFLGLEDESSDLTATSKSSAARSTRSSSLIGSTAWLVSLLATIRPPRLTAPMAVAAVAAFHFGTLIVAPSL